MELTVCFGVLVTLAVAIYVGFTSVGTIFGHGSGGGRVGWNSSIFGFAALFAIGSINCVA